MQPAVSTKAIRLQLERIFSGRGFARAERMKRFLKLAVDYTLAGRGGELKEYLIALEVFDRKADFDPRSDPVVRVEARRLRAKLEEYYAGEGRADEIHIELPVGSYLPRFERRTPRESVPAARGDSQRLAVLPFANLSAESDSDYFSDGLTEELIHALTKVEGLRVVAWTSAARLRGASEDGSEIARQLGVSSYLWGSVRRAGRRVRILVRLMSAGAGTCLWSETWDRDVSDLLAIQEEIASAIASSLRVRFGGGAARPRTLNIDAYQVYLRGRFEWHKRTEPSLRAAIGMFEEALRIDGRFALAWAGVADACNLLAQFGAAPGSEVIAKAKAAARRALELDPALAEAHTSLAFLTALYDWEWDQAEAHCLRAIELNPGYSTAHHWYAADLLALQGRFEEAKREMAVACALDPLAPPVTESAGYVHMLERNYDGATVYYQRAIEMWPEYWRGYSSMGRALSLKGDYDQALRYLERARKTTGCMPSILGALGQTYALAGRPERARELAEELRALAAQRHVASTCFALIHIGLGEHGAALDWLERAVERRELSVTTIGIHPAYDALRNEPRFDALVRKMNLG